MAAPSPCPALTLTVTRYRQGERHEAHEHGELHLSLVIAGSLNERVGQTTESAGALSVVVKDPAVVHANTFGTNGALMARLSVLHRGLDSLADDPARASSWAWSHDFSAAAPFLRLVARAARGDREFPADDDDLADLVALVTRRPAKSLCGTPPVWLVAALQHMQEGWHPALTVKEVAGEAHVHPVYLARCVRRWYGTSAADVLRRVRLQRAAGALAAGRGTVSSFAHAAGYADEPHLCRSFSDASGMTPARFRQLARSAARLDSRMAR